MSNKVFTVLPEKEGCYLAFLPVKDKKQSDVHFGVERDSLVIGSNDKNTSRASYFTDPCLIVGKDGEVRLQYRDENGEYASKDLDAAKVAKAILSMLKKFKKW